MAAGAFHFRKRSPLPLVALIFFFFPLLLVSNLLFPVGTIMGERLLYLPSTGYAVIGAMIFTPLISKKNWAMTGALGLILILFSARTVTRNREWYDDYSLFSSDLKKVPRSIKVLTNLGYLSGKKGQLDESMEYFRKALEIDPDYDDALKGYGRRLYDRRQYEESANYYAKAVRIAPENPDSHTDFAIVLQKLDQYDAAESELRIAIKLNPSKPLPYQEMSSVLIAKQDYRAALEYLRQAESLGGDQRVILNNSAVAQFLSGNRDEAYRLVLRARSRGIQINEELAAAILSPVNQGKPNSP
jgi:tetratricopeptide (TPR) repeat protein